MIFYQENAYENVVYETVAFCSGRNVLTSQYKYINELPVLHITITRIFLSRKSIWKFRLEHVGHIIQTSMHTCAKSRFSLYLELNSRVCHKSPRPVLSPAVKHGYICRSPRIILLIYLRCIACSEISGIVHCETRGHLGICSINHLPLPQ